MKETLVARQFSEEEKKEITDALSGIKKSDPKPFPYWPPQPTEEQMKRMEVMNELNKWANNDPDLARRSAERLLSYCQSNLI